jgi:2-dehydropantoate 2-reductase
VRYVIVGAGAVGGTIGGLLAQAGRDVVLVARGAHLDALRDRGLDLRRPDGGGAVLPLPAAASAGEVDWRTGDVAVLAVKGQDTVAVLDDLVVAAPPDTHLVCAQNGVANEARALRRFAHVHGLCVMLPAAHLEPGVVAAFGDPAPGILDVGRYPSGTDEVDLRVAADLRAAGFASEAHPAIMTAKHRKLLMNLANAAVAVSGTEALDSPMVGAAAAEGEAVFVAAGIDVATAEADKARRDGVFRIAEVEGVPRGGGSTWQSLARGTGSVEADTLNGEVVLLGRMHGVATPVNEHLRRLVQRAAREGWEPGSRPVEDLVPPTTDPRV